MKNDVVFTNEMNQFGFVVLPIVFPILSVFLGPNFRVGNVSNRGIEPHIKYFSFFKEIY